MTYIYDSVTELVGNTPLLRANRIKEKYALKADILLKLEYFNPAGSVKDRIAKAMLEAAEREGLLQPGGTVIEATSGNTGIGLASLAAAKGYRAIFTMPETMSVERRKLLAAYGAEIVLTDGKAGMKGAIAKAKELAEAEENTFIPSQFENQVNPKAHEQTTGPEIWAATGGTVAGLVSGVGTGGTMTGTGRYLKQQKADVHVVAVEPEGSPVLSGGASGPHKIQGIGAGFVPATWDRSVCDEIIKVPDEAALEYAREMSRTEGILVGISSGAALYAAIDLARRPEFSGKTIVAILPDTGERYLSTALFEEA